MPTPLNSAYLATAIAPNQLIYKASIASTNQYLLDNLTDLSKGTLCVAEQQTAGRGRRGRSWHSPAGSQIIMSLYWTLDRQKSIEGLSSVVGLAVADCLNQLGAKVQLKWPNDILLNQRKLGGILIEIGQASATQLHLVIGLGINLSLAVNEPIDQPWANLNEVLENIDPNPLIGQLYQNIIAYLQYFEKQGIDPLLQQQWQQLDAYYGEQVKVIREQHIINGINQGIDHKGYLLLETVDKQILAFNGGEVSLRKA